MNMTRMAIKDSLSRLLNRKPLDKITIRDITDDCGIARMTFYYHFHDIYDLVEWACLVECEKAAGDHVTSKTWSTALRKILEKMRSNRQIVMNVYHSVSQERIKIFLYPVVKRMIEEAFREDFVRAGLRSEDSTFIVDFYTYALSGLLFDWVKNDMQREPAQITEYLSVIFTSSMDAFVRHYRMESGEEQDNRV